MPTGLSIKVESSEAKARFREMSRRAAEPTGLARLLIPIMRKSISTTFMEEGIPAGAWRAVTRSGQGGIPRRILFKSGALYRSIRENVNAGNARVRVDFYSDLVYAGIHQYGGIIRSRTGKPLRFQVWMNGGFQWRSKSSVRIPATPFLVFRDEDPELLRQAVSDYLLNE